MYRFVQERIICRIASSECYMVDEDKTTRRNLKAENTQHVAILVFPRAAQRRFHESIVVPCEFRVPVRSLSRRLSSPNETQNVTRVRVGVDMSPSRHAIT